MKQRKAMEANARKQDADLAIILTNQKNKPISDEFDKLKKKHFDVAWYRPAGPNSIADMVSRLDLESEYEFFYSQFSDITHVGAFDKHVKFDGNAVIFEPLRSPENIDTLVNVVASLAFRLFRLIINKYSPNEMTTFTHNYVSEWRNRFLSIPKVVIKEPKK